MITKYLNYLTAVLFLLFERSDTLLFNDNDIEIFSEIRLKNDFGGMWGNKNFVELRRLSAKGIVNNKIGFSIGDIYLKQTKFTLYNYILIDIKDSDRLFSFLNTRKKMRKNIKKIFVNLDYNFLNNQIKFNNIKMDNQEFNDQSLVLINDNNFKNRNKNRQILNELFSIYEG